jgi:hypothetical protein
MREWLKEIQIFMHINVIEVWLQPIIVAHILNEIYLLNESLFIDDTDYILIGEWHIVETCSDVVRESMDTREWQFTISWIGKISLHIEASF